MSAARRLVATFVGIAALALALSAQTSQEEAWITLERPVAEQAIAAFGAAGRAGALSIEGEGMVVVGRLGEQDVPLLAQWLHRQRGHCGGFMAHLSREAAIEEAARANREEGSQAALAAINYTIDNGAVVQALLSDIQETNILGTINSLSNFSTRYHNCASGRQSSSWIRSLWQGYAQGRSDVTVLPFRHTGFTTKQPSVILTIQGTVLPLEVVVLGAHQDSILNSGNNCSTSRAPGADDDASGVASLSEVIRVALSMGYQPQRTVKFMAYAAEEVGLRGSGDIAANFQQQGTNVVGVFQLDMTNYKGSSSDIYLINDYTNAAQNTFLADLIDTYLAGITRGTTICQYACSSCVLAQQGLCSLLPLRGLFPAEPSPSAVQHLPPHAQRHACPERQQRQPRAEVLEAGGRLHGRAGQGDAALIEPQRISRMAARSFTSFGN